MKMSLKPILFLSLAVSLITCKTNQDSLKIPVTSHNCPEEGKCMFQVLPNSSLNFKTDDIGKLYPEISKGTKTVLKFEYKRNEDPRIADDGYTELIYIELDPGMKTLQLQDQKLKQAKVLFGRLCFCGDQAGYFPVEKGNLEVSTNKDKTVNYSLDFEISNLPQQIKGFSITK
jgi:hypothetical protein